MTACAACLQGAVSGQSDWGRCTRCGALVRTSRREPVETLDVHDELYFGPEPSFEMSPVRHLRQYLQFIDRYRPLEDAQVVDIGCGVSEMGALVRQAGASYTGVEPSARGRDEMRRRGFDVHAGADQAAEVGPFDIALLIEVIEHTHEPRTLLHGIRSLLAHHGVVFLTTPNAGGLKARLLDARWEQACNPTHVCLFTRQALEETVAACGFRELRWQRWLRNDAPPARRAVQRLLQAVGLDGGLRLLARGC